MIIVSEYFEGSVKSLGISLPKENQQLVSLKVANMNSGHRA
jgi:uncharacterized protein YaiE (UPF0345 family)